MIYITPIIHCTMTHMYSWFLLGPLGGSAGSVFIIYISPLRDVSKPCFRILTSENPKEIIESGFLFFADEETKVGQDS